MGRKTRSIPPAIQRASTRETKGCLPLHHKKYTDAHHIKHWAEEGRRRCRSREVVSLSSSRCMKGSGGQVLDDGAIRSCTERRALTVTRT